MTRRYGRMVPDLRARGLRPLVTLRHPILIAFALLSAWGVRSNADWGLLSRGGRALFGASPLSTYAKTPGLQAGPPALAVVRALDLLPGIGGELAAHLVIAALGWFMLLLAERWAVPGSRLLSISPADGLLSLLVGVPVLREWATLAGAMPHIEDSLALLTFLLAVQAVAQQRPELAGFLVGLAAAWKPWAVVAVPMLWGLPRRGRSRCRALGLAVAVPAICWLPFVLGDHATLAAVSDGFTLRARSPLHVFGMNGQTVPGWWRTAELIGAFGVSLVVAWRRDWRAAFAAGCAARLLLDPAGFDYYVAGLVMATALTERVCGLRPWRTFVLLVATVYAAPLLAMHIQVELRFAAFAAVAVSWPRFDRRVAPLRPSHPGAPLVKPAVFVRRERPLRAAQPWQMP